MNKKNCFTKVKNHFIKNKVIYFFIFIFLIYNLNFRVLESADNTPARYIPLSLINEGNFDLNEYVEFLFLKKEHLIEDLSNGTKVNIPYYLFNSHGHYIAKNSPLNGVFNIPVFVIASSFLDLNFGHWIIIYLSKLTATILITFSALFIFLSSKKLTSEKNSFLITIIFSFCSNVWTIASQDFWSHTSSIFFLSMSIYFLIRALKEKSYIKYLGLSISGAVFVRSSNIFFALIFILYIIFYYYEYLKSFFIYTIPLSSFFLVYNLFYKSSINNILIIILYVLLINIIFYFLLLFFGLFIRKFKRKTVLIIILSFLLLIFIVFMNFKIMNSTFLINLFADSFYLFIMNQLWTANFLEGFFGLFLSPSRGILIFSPIFIFSFIFLFSSFKKIKKTNFERLSFYLFLSVISLFLFFAKYFQWYGGWSYGYRMVLDTVPMLCILLIPSLKFIAKNSFLKKLFIFLIIFSLLIQLLGVLSYDYSWNLGADKGCNIDECTKRVWSLKDSQIIHYLQTPRIHYCYPIINPFQILCKEKFV